MEKWTDTKQIQCKHLLELISYFFFSGQKINIGLKIIHVIFITLNHSMYPGVFSLVYFSAYISNTVYCLLFFLERYGISLCILIDLPSSLIIYTTYSLQENNIDLNDYIIFIFRIHHPYLPPLLSIPAKRSVDLVILQQISFYLNVSSYSDQVLRLDSQK